MIVLWLAIHVGLGMAVGVVAGALCALYPVSLPAGVSRAALAVATSARRWVWVRQRAGETVGAFDRVIPTEGESVLDSDGDASRLGQDAPPIHAEHCGSRLSA